MSKVNNKTLSAKCIVFTGGGSAGHVTPNIAVINKCLHEGWQVAYIGSAQGIEKQIVSNHTIPFYSIASGKLRRYFSWQNFIDPFKILFATGQSFFLLRKIKPRLIFSKGGFVSVPVVVAAWLRRIPVIAHESDLTPGLANRLSLPFVSKICITYPKSKKFFKKQDKVIVTGAPLREELFHGCAARGRSYCQFNTDKDVLLISGGGLGSALINQTVRAALPQLVEKFNIIHLCGQGKMDHSYDNLSGYQQFDYVNDELPDLLAAANIVISRSGSNSVYELLALKKPHIFIPLSTKASRGDQIDNAKFGANEGLSTVINEEALDANTLLRAIDAVQANISEIQIKLENFSITSGTQAIYQVISDLGSNSTSHKGDTKISTDKNL
ncbi:MAG: undecaprenyldiphospho-muramoylpentapeptide beta-N-acetylglucosaminyltransferase [Gammaproteobacteria bacterium]